MLGIFMGIRRNAWSFHIRSNSGSLPTEGWMTGLSVTRHVAPLAPRTVSSPPFDGIARCFIFLVLISERRPKQAANSMETRVFLIEIFQERTGHELLKARVLARHALPQQHHGRFQSRTRRAVQFD